jgi:D-inositol-3-phosphate glycosyltransferase
MSRKKIVIVGPAWPLRGGLSTYNERLCLQFQNEGYDCSILSFKLQYPNFLFPGKTQFSSEPAPENTLIETAINSINPFNWIKVGLKYKKLAPDILVFRYWMPFMAPCLGTIARLVSSNKKTKIIAIADNIYPHEKHFYDNICTQYFVKSIHGFITMSESVLNELKQLVPHKPSQYIAHPMYDNFGDSIGKIEAKKALQIDENVNYLLFFGFVRAYKGLDLLLRAFSDERLRTLNLKLIIAGEYYEDAAPYQKLIEDLKLGELIVQHNEFIPNSEVSKYFSAADLVVQTYNSATQSGVTQIAYHFNKPMLVTNVGGLAETVPHNKVGYVIERDETEIADAILDFYNNNREPEMSKNAEEFKKTFSWKKITAAILN